MIELFENMDCPFWLIDWYADIIILQSGTLDGQIDHKIKSEGGKLSKFYKL